MTTARTTVTALAMMIIAGCSEELQVHEHIGTVVTQPNAVATADIRFVDRGRWTLFQLVDNAPTGDWPLPFHVELLDSRDRVLLAKTIHRAEVQTDVSRKGHRNLTFRVDDIHSTSSEKSQESNWPIDNVLADGEGYTVRFTLPKSSSHRYEVALLSLRRLYPWQYQEN